MSNRIFETLINEKIETFRNEFVNSSRRIFYEEASRRLIHPGEFGTYRESICREFVRFFIPRRLDIDSGFVITRDDQVSTQCDIIVYDTNSTPLVESGEKQKFFPVETTIAIGEIKSVLDKSQFREALNKLARIKKLREGMSATGAIRKKNPGPFNPINDAYDQIFSFLICQKFNFKADEIISEFNSIYDKEIEPRNRHNLILSLEDGIFFYHDPEGKMLPYPDIKETYKNAYQSPIDIRDNPHIRLFCHFLFMGTSSASIFYPEMNGYIGNFGELKTRIE